MQNSLSFAKLVKYIEGYSFGEFFNSDTVDNFIDYLYKNSEEYQTGKWRCTYGATKLVIIMEKEDFVFKIPFNSEWDNGEDDYVFFYGAPATSTWDYCEAEEERYDFAEEMWEETVVRSKAHNVMRSRFQVEYDIAKCKFDPYASVELFNSMRLEKTRLTVGVEYKYKKQHVVNVFYRYENSNEANDDEDANMHIIGLGYQYKF